MTDEQTLCGLAAEFAAIEGVEVTSDIFLLTSYLINTRTLFLDEHDGCEVERIAAFLVALNHESVSVKSCSHINALKAEFGILVCHSHRGLVAQLAAVTPFCEHIDDIIRSVSLRVEA